MYIEPNVARISTRIDLVMDIKTTFYCFRKLHPCQLYIISTFIKM